MKILHTEASLGWGGQEIRIFEESLGMRERGHDLFFAVGKGAPLALPLRKAGFIVYELPFTKKKVINTLWQLFQIVRNHQIEIINVHSSLDSWCGGIIGRWMKKKVIRTRHLSTAIRPGLNSRLLYNTLANHVVTTCAEVVSMIHERAKMPKERITSIPTGVNPQKFSIDKKNVSSFREGLGIRKEEIVVGTTCVIRKWKGIEDFLYAAKLLEREEQIKFLLVGSGPHESIIKDLHKKLGLEKKVLFTGYLSPPFAAISTMDIFALLSRANEGISQATLQAAYLEKPLITTATGGLKEVCLHEETGLIVPINSAEQVAEAIKKLAVNCAMRKEFGIKAKALVENHFLFETMLDKMEEVYGSC